MSVRLSVLDAPGSGIHECPLADLVSFPCPHLYERKGVAFPTDESRWNSVRPSGQLLPLDRGYGCGAEIDGRAAESELGGTAGSPLPTDPPPVVFRIVGAIPDALLLDVLGERMGHGLDVPRPGEIATDGAYPDAARHYEFLQSGRAALYGQAGQPARRSVGPGSAPHLGPEDSPQWGAGQTPTRAEFHQDLRQGISPTRSHTPAPRSPSPCPSISKCSEPPKTRNRNSPGARCARPLPISTT